MAKPKAVDENHQVSPEERFRELVAIREKEKEIEAKLEAARAEAAQRLEEDLREIQQMRAEVERQTREEVERLRSQAVREAEAEAQELLARAEAEAEEICNQAGERVGQLVERFKRELFANE